MIDSEDAMNDISGRERSAYGTDESEFIEAERAEISGGCRGRTGAGELGARGLGMGAGARRRKTARNFYGARGEPTLELGGAVRYGAAESTADPADRPARAAGNATALFPDRIYAQ